MNKKSTEPYLATYVKRIAESVPVFHLPCTPDESAVIALEKVL